METRRAQCANLRRQMQNCFSERHWVTNSFLGREGTALCFVIPDIGMTVLCSSNLFVLEPYNKFSNVFRFLNMQLALNWIFKRA